MKPCASEPRWTPRGGALGSAPNLHVIPGRVCVCVLASHRPSHLGGEASFRNEFQGADWAAPTKRGCPGLAGAAVVIDAGLAFPRDEHLGVDLILPDFSYLVDRDRPVRAVLLTHGHEDHVGA